MCSNQHSYSLRMHHTWRATRAEIWTGRRSLTHGFRLSSAVVWGVKVRRAFVHNRHISLSHSHFHFPHIIPPSLPQCSACRVPEWKYSQCKLMPFNGQGLSASSALWSSAARALAQEESLHYTGAISLTLQWCSEKLRRKGLETKKKHHVGTS